MTMNGKGRMKRCGHVPANNLGDGRDDKEARVACLGSDSEDFFAVVLEGLKERE